MPTTDTNAKLRINTLGHLMFGVFSSMKQIIVLYGRMLNVAIIMFNMDTWENAQCGHYYV